MKALIVDDSKVACTYITEVLESIYNIIKWTRWIRGL